MVALIWPFWKTHKYYLHVATFKMDTLSENTSISGSINKQFYSIFHDFPLKIFNLRNFNPTVQSQKGVVYVIASHLQNNMILQN